MKTLIILTIFSVAIYATTTEDDVSLMITKLQTSIRKLDCIQRKLESEINRNLEVLKTKSQSNGGSNVEENLKCLNQELDSFKEKMNQKIDESLGGYAQSSKTLIRDLENGMYQGEELDHVGHMLSPQGSYYQQMMNSIRFLEDQLKSDYNVLVRNVEENCSTV